MRVRAATPSDVAAIAAIHVASAEDAYHPLAPEQWKPRSVTERTELWADLVERDTHTILLAELEAEPRGFVCVNPPRDSRLGDVELSVIHVLPTFRGLGLGKALWEAALRTVEPGRSLYLETYAELPCCAFYASRGARRTHEEPAEYFGASVRRVVYAITA